MYLHLCVIVHERERIDKIRVIPSELQHISTHPSYPERKLFLIHKLFLIICGIVVSMWCIRSVILAVGNGVFICNQVLVIAIQVLAVTIQVLVCFGYHYHHG